MCLAIPGLILSIDSGQWTMGSEQPGEFASSSNEEGSQAHRPTPDNDYPLPTAHFALDRVGQVKFGGITKEVNLAYVPEAKVGDYVIVHVGFAISTLNEAEANRVFDYLREMDELAELAVSG